MKINTVLPVAGEYLLGQSSVMKALRQKIHKLSSSQAPIYISGPSGSGKELVARLIHELSPRKEQPFVPINCGAIPKDLMESEFFGYKKGSFTGAHQDKFGFFHAAEGGTLFLDEVGDLSLDMQVKLLRAIQAKAIRPLGASLECMVNVRILCATHKNLRQLVDQYQFREDLFYRLNVIEVAVPSLSDRKDDIPLLINYILQKLSKRNNLKQPLVNIETQKILLEYHYPGNVRELENILERAMTLCDNHIILPIDLHLPIDRPQPSKSNGFILGSDNLEEYLDELAKNMILKALEHNRWCKSDAAKMLGISLRTLRYRLKKLELEMEFEKLN